MTEGHDELDEFVYLELDDALEIFAAIVGATTQQAADQLRSPSALEGALGRPASYAHYEQLTLPSRRRCSPTGSHRLRRS